MQIQTGYSSSQYSASAFSNRTVVAAGQDKANDTGSTESPAYKAISNRAAMLLSNSHISASESARILSLLARAKNAAVSGSTGELNALLSEMKNLDQGLGVKSESPSTRTSRSQESSAGPNEDTVAYQDQSDDVGVSFSSPVAMNQYQAPLAVQAHEGEHVMIARAEAIINNENVTTYVSIHNGYDGNGRLITTGGTTTVKTSPKPKMEPLKIATKINTIA